MSMINRVRETVLSILNKNNYGYISPIDFNLFAEQAQLDLFQDYFYEFNKQINAENQRLSGTESADINRQIQEVIDTFTQFQNLSLSLTPQVSTQTFDLPNDWYTFVEVIWGQNCSRASDDVANKEAERVSEYQIRRLLRSNLTAPSTLFPAYILTQQGYPATEGPGSGAPPGGTYGNLSNQITLFPAPTSGCTLSCGLTYVRYPKTPNWTYSTLTDAAGAETGEAIFNPSLANYQDFELPLSDSTDIVNKILQYAGMSIREIAVVNFGQAEQKEQDAEESVNLPTKRTR